jgi:DNA-binding transcriptional LysR family regulator
MELRHLRYFLAVAEERNFSRAAERLGIRQPPLSTQIHQLEKELGTPLFRRLTRGVELTPAGILFLEQARRILEQIEQAKIDVNRRARGESGQISLGAAGVCYFHPRVGLIIDKFLRSYPHVVVSPEESDTVSLVACVHSGKTDAAFVRSPSLAFDGLALEPVAEEDMIAALPDGPEFHHARSVTLTSLAKEKFVLTSRKLNTGLHDSILAACRRAGFEPSLGFEAPSLIATIAMIAAGQGIAVVPQSLSRLRLKGVIYLPIKGERVGAPIKLVHRVGERSPTVRNLISIVRRLRTSSADAPAPQ